MTAPVTPTWTERYRVLETLGSGSMGIVHRAVHLPLNREVALKTLLPQAEDTEYLLERFRREALGLSAVNHPGLCKVFEVSGEGEDPYLAMELIDGPTLDAAVKQSPLRLRRIGDLLFFQLLEAVAAIHSAGLMHRDLKPSNVMLGPGDRPIVMDLGLVKDVGGRWGRMTQTGILVGTPAYLAPELITGSEATFASDVWALGALYFFLHAGQSAFRADTIVALANAICRDPLPDLDIACADLPLAQRKFMLALLERNPAKRFPDAGEALRAFGRIVGSTLSLVPVHRVSAAAAPVAPADAAPVVKPPRTEAPGAGEAKGKGSARTPRPGSRSRRPPSIGWALAGGITAGLLIFAVKLSTGPPPAPAPAKPTPSAAASAPLAALTFIAGPHPVASPLFMRWSAFTSFRARLEAGGLDASTATHELRRRSPVALDGAAGWLHWFELGAWLDGPPGRRRDDRPANSTIAALQPALLNTATWQAQVPSGRVLATAIETTLFAPRTPEGWLTLGALLEDEGAAPQALNAYRVGLEVLGRDAVPSEAPVLTWRGLARALDTVPGYSLKYGWRRHLPPGMAHRRAWRGLQLASPASDRYTARMLMRSAVDREAPAAGAVLGTDFEVYDQEPEAARQHWEGMLVLRGNFEVEAALHEHWLTRGQIGHPRDPFPPDGSADLLTGPARDLKQLPPEGLKAPRRTARLVRYLEARDLAHAREEGEKAMFAGLLSAGALPGELARAGDLSPSNDRECQAVVDRADASWSDLERMAGSLSSPVNAPWFAQRMLAGGPRAVGACARLAVALWHSRSNRHAEALDVLAPLIDAPHVKEEHAEVLAEVYGRPLWQRLLDDGAPPPVLARLPRADQPPAAIHRRSAEVWRALRAEERGRTLTLAKDGFDANPRSLSTLFAYAYSAAAGMDPSPARSTLAQVRAAARYQALPLWVLDELERVELTIPK